MKTKHTSVSNNTLIETANLLAALSNLIERDYLHVAENISPSIKKSINLEMDKVQKEIEKRENY